MSHIERDTLTTYNPIAVPLRATLVDIVGQMDQYEIHHVPVVDDNFQLLGIVSDLDVARTVSSYPKLTGQAAQPELAHQEVPLPVADDMMVRSVVAIGRDDPPEAALQAILEHGFHSVPVVADGKLVGIITSTDFLREFSYGSAPACRHQVSRYMNRNLLQIESTAAPETARRLMAEHGQRYLTVTWDGRPLGVLSKRQLRQAHRIDLILDSPWVSDKTALWRRVETVSQLLPALPKPFSALQSMGQAALTMFEQGHHGLPVIWPDGQLAGIITELEVLKCLATCFNRLEIAG